MIYDFWWLEKVVAVREDLVAKKADKKGGYRRRRLGIYVAVLRVWLSPLYGIELEDE